jgi:hypothetical protein
LNRHGQVEADWQYPETGLRHVVPDGAADQAGQDRQAVDPSVA